MSVFANPSALLPGRPVSQFGEQLVFLVMVWAGFAVTVMLITAFVSFFRPIEMSGWSLAYGAPRWFAFGICAYLGYSVLELHVLHGQTRRAFFVRLFAFIPVYAALMAALFAVTFFAEAAYYALAGWPHVMDDGHLFSNPFQSHLVFLETWMVACVWGAGGVALGLGFYRSSLFGALLIPIGLLVSGLSSGALGDDQLPFAIDQLFSGIAVSLPTALLVHLGLFLGLAALCFGIARDMPIKSKAAKA